MFGMSSFVNKAEGFTEAKMKVLETLVASYSAILVQNLPDFDKPEAKLVVRHSIANYLSLHGIFGLTVEEYASLNGEEKTSATEGEIQSESFEAARTCVEEGIMAVQEVVEKRKASSEVKF